MPFPEGTSRLPAECTASSSPSNSGPTRDFAEGPPVGISGILSGLAAAGPGCRAKPAVRANQTLLQIPEWILISFPRAGVSAGTGSHNLNFMREGCSSLPNRHAGREL